MVTIRPPMQHVPDEVVFGGASAEPAQRYYTEADIAAARRAAKAEERERCAKAVFDAIYENGCHGTMADWSGADAHNAIVSACAHSADEAIRALPDGD